MARIQWGDDQMPSRNQLAGDDFSRFTQLLAQERPGAVLELSFLVDEASYNVITSVPHAGAHFDGKFLFEAWFFSMNYDEILLLGSWHDQPLREPKHPRFETD